MSHVNVTVLTAKYNPTTHKPQTTTTSMLAAFAGFIGATVLMVKRTAATNAGAAKTKAERTRLWHAANGTSERSPPPVTATARADGKPAFYIIINNVTGL